MKKVQIIKDENMFYVISDEGVVYFNSSWGSGGVPLAAMNEIERIFDAPEKKVQCNCDCCDTG